MPTYVFTCDCGETFEEYMSIEDMVTEAKCKCGATAQRDYGQEHRGGIPSGERGYFKHISESMAVHPSERLQTIEEDRKMGSMASEYLSDGRLAFKSMRQLRKYQENRNMVDKNSYY